MKFIQNISFLIVLSITLGACKSEPKITQHRGKVKFETLSISSKLAGRVAQIYVEEGQDVKKGDTLAFIDIPEVSAKIMQAEGAITSARGQLDMAANGATVDQLNQINEQYNSSVAQLEFAEESYKRMSNMLKDSLISQQQFDEVKMKRDMAKAQVEAIGAKRQEIRKGARSEQLTQAKGQLDRAKGAKEEALTAESEKYIIAPADMSIETISLKEGELLTPGYALFNGYITNSIFFRFTIPESEIYNFKKGNEIIVVNPYTKDEIKAEIKTINQLAQYADITSTSPIYHLDESIYELKVEPKSNVGETPFYLNSTVILKD